MKVINLTKDSNVYTSNVYLVTGDWNTLKDVNTLIDVGADSTIIGKINTASTGVGKKQIEQVILTHCHSDHTSLLKQIKEMYTPQVLAFSSNLEDVDLILYGGEIIEAGDRVFEVIHAPGHSSDSICLYCEEEETLFVGDSPVIINSVDGTYSESYIKVLESLCQKQISTIYFGHGKPLKQGCKEALLNSYKNVVKKRKVKKKHASYGR